MNTRMGVAVTALCAAVLAVGGHAAWAQAPAAMQAKFGAAGLTSLQYGGVEFLADGKPAIGPVRVEGAEGKLEAVDTKGGKVAVSPDGRTVRHDYEWGTVDCSYLTTDNRLTLKVRVANKSVKPIGQFDMKLLEVRFPEAPKGSHWAKNEAVKGDNVDDVTILTADYGTGVLVVTNDEPADPLRFGFGGGQGAKKDVHRIELSTLITNVSAWDHVIPPGQTAEWNFSLRFGPAGATGEELAKDVIARLNVKYPYRLKWDDRRPIGMIMRSAGTWGDAKYKTNPRGYLSDPKIDVTTPEGRADFRAKMLKDADRCIKSLQAVNAQGMIYWDLEGEEFPHPTTYVGNPLVLKEIAPEMDEISEELFKRYADAGLRPGICIRPSRFLKDTSGEGKYPYRHGNMGYDVADYLCQKVEYAKKRWGVTLFYMDTDVVWAYDRDKQPVNRLVPAEIFQKINAKFPDVLVMPEFGSTASYAYTAVYHEVRDQPWANKTSTPANVLRVYPQAFCLLNTGDAKFDEKRMALTASSKRGDLMLFRGWFDDTANPIVKAIYEEAHPAAAEK